ncbi:MAG: hypothetical protein LBJ25_05850 [Candidatus Margulisbacteria bacterium]|jgi:microcystin-dependent protein|nr:hypothetical protein [Candidatus Margulisiibacteriota bacterium]
MTIATGEKMYAADILNLTFFPKGTLLTFSSAAWGATGAEFKNIWKICNAANHAVDPNIPDLTDKFLRGAGSSGVTGGSNSGSADITLTDVNLPGHNHPLTGTLTTSNESQGHTHSVTAAGNISGEGTHAHSVTDVNDPGHKHDLEVDYDSNGTEYYPGAGGARQATTSLAVVSSKTGISITGGGTHGHTFSGSSVASEGASASHTHTLTLNGNTGDFGSASATPIQVSINTVPEYYTVIYIIKII